ncbi:MAG: hypothetical protein Q7S95_02390 [bacterium]|nr:hypothetical protein [bacterium]
MNDMTDVAAPHFGQRRMNRRLIPSVSPWHGGNGFGWPDNRINTPTDRFMRPLGAGMTVEMLAGKQWPRVHLTPEAHGKTWALVQECDIEVGWLSTCSKTADGNFVIDDVFVPAQRCTPASTTITEDGKAGLLDVLLRERRHDAINHLGCWGHSHVNMGVSASRVDEDQAEEYVEERRDQGHDHFIRVIANKRGDFFVSLYLLDRDMILHHAPLEVEKSEPEAYLEWAKGEIERKVKRQIMSVANFGAWGSGLDAYDLPMLDGWLALGVVTTEAYDRLKTRFTGSSEEEERTNGSSQGGEL